MTAVAAAAEVEYDDDGLTRLTTDAICIHHFAVLLELVARREMRTIETFFNNCRAVFFFIFFVVVVVGGGIK